MNWTPKNVISTKISVGGAFLLYALLTTAALNLSAQTSASQKNSEGSVMNNRSKFYCNVKALSPAERDHHKKLTDKLTAARKGVIETGKGYEFQFSPTAISLVELAEWVENESKCCPFFDFHIDVEHEATLLCLRLTGDEGVKAFIRAEFHLPPK